MPEAMWTKRCPHEGFSFFTSPKNTTNPKYFQTYKKLLNNESPDDFSVEARLNRE